MIAPGGRGRGRESEKKRLKQGFWYLILFLKYFHSFPSTWTLAFSLFLWNNKGLLEAIPVFRLNSLSLVLFYLLPHGLFFPFIIPFETEWQLSKGGRYLLRNSHKVCTTWSNSAMVTTKRINDMDGLLGVRPKGNPHFLEANVSSWIL